MDATQAKAHALEWVRLLDHAAMVPQCAYAVVAHNAPTNIWDGMGNSKMAIEEIEAQNDCTTLEISISNISWLNSDNAQQGTGCGPLMINFKSKDQRCCQCCH